MTLDIPGTENTLDRVSPGCDKPDGQNNHSKRTGSLFAPKKIIEFVTLRQNSSACSVNGIKLGWVIV